jgi:hypothetical protein
MNSCNKVSYKTVKNYEIAYDLFIYLYFIYLDYAKKYIYIYAHMHAFGTIHEVCYTSNRNK